MGKYNKTRFKVTNDFFFIDGVLLLPTKEIQVII